MPAVTQRQHAPSGAAPDLGRWQVRCTHTRCGAPLVHGRRSTAMLPASCSLRGPWHLALRSHLSSRVCQAVANHQTCQMEQGCLVQLLPALQQALGHLPRAPQRGRALRCRGRAISSQLALLLPLLLLQDEMADGGDVLACRGLGWVRWGVCTSGRSWQGRRFGRLATTPAGCQPRRLQPCAHVRRATRPTARAGPQS